jgi:hypothetical protein
MDLQLLLVFTLFALAVLWLGKMVYRSMASKKACSSNCGKCAADFSDIKIPEARR